MRTIVRMLISSLPLWAILLVIVEVVVTNELVGLGTKLNELEEMMAVQKDKREIFLTQVASASSLVTLEGRAREMGFFEPTKHQILSLTPEQFPLTLGQRQ